MENIIIIKGLNATQMINSVNSANKKMQAGVLSKLEFLIDDEENFKEIRKLFLDATNDFSREVIRTLIGDVEV